MRGRGRPAACWATPPLKHPKLMGRGADCSSAPPRGACAFRSERRRRISQISHASAEISSTHRATPSLDTQAAQVMRSRAEAPAPKEKAAESAEAPAAEKPAAEEKAAEPAAAPAAAEAPAAEEKVAEPTEAPAAEKHAAEEKAAEPAAAPAAAEAPAVEEKAAEPAAAPAAAEAPAAGEKVAYPIIQNDNVEEYFTETKQWAPDPGMPDAVALQATACIKDFACSGRKKNKQ